LYGGGEWICGWRGHSCGCPSYQKEGKELSRSPPIGTEKGDLKGASVGTRRVDALDEKLL